MTTPTRRPWAPGAATGVGSLPGDDFLAAVRLVLETTPEFPYLPELPARGPGADLVGRAAAHLAELHVDLQPSGWRVVPRTGVDERRARGLLAADLDTFADELSGINTPVKLQVAGPWTLAAALQRTRGGAAVADPGAVRDLAASLTEGTAALVAEVQRRLSRAAVVVQLDEPALPAVLAGSLPTESGFGRVPAVPPETVTATLAEVLSGVGGAAVLVHCCADVPPVGVLAATGADGLSVDVTAPATRVVEELGVAVESGLSLFAGAVPSLDPGRRIGATDLAAPVRTLWRQIGAAADHLPAGVVVTPTCGLAGASPSWARTALLRCAETARVLAEAPDGVHTP